MPRERSAALKTSCAPAFGAWGTQRRFSEGGLLSYCGGSAPLFTPLVAPFASLFTPFVAPFASLLTPFHSRRLGLGIRCRQHHRWRCQSERES
jgi:hypothetical protein